MQFRHLALGAALISIGFFSTSSALAAPQTITSPIELNDSSAIITVHEENHYILGANEGDGSLVRIYQEDGTLRTSFNAYPEGYNGGTTIAVCDLDNDGDSEIITGTREGGGPQVRIFDLDGSIVHEGFFAYAESFRGGVNADCGDIDGDGEIEIVTSPGVSGSAHIRSFNTLGELEDEVILGSAAESVGSILRVGNVDGDSRDEIVAVRRTNGNNDVFIIESTASLKPTFSFKATEIADTSLMLSLVDANQDGRDEIVALPRNMELNRIDYFNLFGEVVESEPLETPITGTTRVLLHPSGTKIIRTNPEDTGDRGALKITVDLSEQRLYAFEGTELINTFLISSGTNQFPTPMGTTEVTAKLPVHRYVWSYGPGNPNNYDIPNVQWNLRFRQHYYIHSATWHNNFGRPMSHGCINVSVPNAEWIYNWAEVGTTVEIIP